MAAATSTTTTSTKLKPQTQPTKPKCRKYQLISWLLYSHHFRPLHLDIIIRIHLTYKPKSLSSIDVEYVYKWLLIGVIINLFKK